MKEKLQEVWRLIQRGQAAARRAGDLPTMSTAAIRIHSIKHDIELSARALEHLDKAASRHYALVRILFAEATTRSVARSLLRPVELGWM